VGYEQLATRGATSFNKKNFKLEATGQQKKFKVPHGISLWGGLFEEEKILNFGIALENALDVYKERPSLPIESC
jgi:hypothetical protein